MPEINHLEALTPEQRAAIQAILAGAAAPPLPPRARRRKNKSDAVQYLTLDELGLLFRVITAAGNPRDLALFEVAYHRGLRASEVGLLQMSHLRLEAKRLFVTRLKSGQSAEYVLTDREVRALKSWLRKRGKEAGPLFPSRNHRPIGRQRLHKLMKRYAAGLPPEKRHFHCLRHSSATSLLDQEGVGIEDVQDHLGHRDIRNTMIYAKISNKRRTRTGERLRNEW